MRSTPRSVTLPDGERAPAMARAFVAEHLAGFEPEIVNNVELVVSELVTGAVRRGFGLRRVVLDADPSSRIVVAVADGERPTSAEPSLALDPLGRMIVEGVADRWGTSFDADGRWVWAAIRPETVGAPGRRP